jgi:hypothetical protein
VIRSGRSYFSLGQAGRGKTLATSMTRQAIEFSEKSIVSMDWFKGKFTGKPHT